MTSNTTQVGQLGLGGHGLQGARPDSTLSRKHSLLEAKRLEYSLTSQCFPPGLLLPLLTLGRSGLSKIIDNRS